MAFRWNILFLCAALIDAEYPREVPPLGLNPFGRPIVDDDFVAGDEIPGVAGADYPVYSQVPPTGFTCDAHPVPGYYADPLSGCQAFYICGESGRGASFLCPNGTVFNQKELVCDWWYHFDCGLAEQYYAVNEVVAASMAAVDAANGVPSPLIPGYPAAASVAGRLPSAAIAARYSPVAAAAAAGVSPLAYNPAAAAASAHRVGPFAAPFGGYAASAAANLGLPFAGRASYFGRYAAPGAAFVAPGAAYAARYTAPGAAYTAPGAAFVAPGAAYAARYTAPGAPYATPGLTYALSPAAAAARFSRPLPVYGVPFTPSGEPSASSGGGSGVAFAGSGGGVTPASVDRSYLPPSK